MPIRKERTMSRKDDKPKNHSYDVENIEDNFAISVLSLVLTATLVLLCVGYFSLLFPENGKLPGGLFGLFAGLAVYFVCFILSLITTVTSLIGFLLGHSSIKGFETKRKTRKPTKTKKRSPNKSETVRFFMPVRAEKRAAAP